uniref:(northern house mosquito) hypothetical protein n=1 Tax=Culex pipiens TaxID=7175 RepID=A0A8D8GWG0_CULPI
MFSNFYFFIIYIIVKFIFTLVYFISVSIFVIRSFAFLPICVSASKIDTAFFFVPNSMQNVNILRNSINVFPKLPKSVAGTPPSLSWTGSSARSWPPESLGPKRRPQRSSSCRLSDGLASTRRSRQCPRFRLQES